MPLADYAAVLYAGMTYPTAGSSAIRSFKYDYASNTLIVNFLKGQSYAYDGVPVDVVEAWIQSGSRGRFFVGNIRNVYAYHRL